MKRRLFILVLSLLFISLTVSAAGIFIELPPDFRVFWENDQNPQAAKILGLSGAELSEYMREQDIVFIATDESNTRQVRIRETADEFSRRAGDFSALSDKDILVLAPKLTGAENCSVVKRDAQKFIFVEETLYDSGGEFTLTRYLTVADGKIYTLAFYNTAGADTAYIGAAFESFTVRTAGTKGTPPEEEKKLDPRDFLFPAGITLFGLGAIVIGITVLRDIRKKA